MCPQVAHHHAQFGLPHKELFCKAAKSMPFFFVLHFRQVKTPAFESCWFGSAFYLCMERVPLLACLNASTKVYCISVSKNKCMHLQIQHTTDLGVNVSYFAEVAHLSSWLQISQGRLWSVFLFISKESDKLTVESDQHFASFLKG